MLKRLMTVGLVSMLLAGCVTVGSNYDPAAVERLQVGMPKAQVIALLGKPTTVATLPDGRQQLMWVQGSSKFLGPSSGRAVMLTFAPDGTYAGMVSQAETNLR